MTPPDPRSYLVIIEGGSDTNYGAWSPDLLGCVSTGDTVEECEANMREAIAFHLEGMKEDGEEIPVPVRAAAAWVPVDAVVPA